MLPLIQERANYIHNWQIGYLVSNFSNYNHINKIYILKTSLPFDFRCRRHQIKWRILDSLKADGSLERYPQIAFLGTSSAIPGAYRNVSSTLVELSPTAAILVDVGEGTVGQMRVLYGPDKLSQLLLRLNAIFTTHSHQVRVHFILFVLFCYFHFLLFTA